MILFYSLSQFNSVSYKENITLCYTYICILTVTLLTHNVVTHY